jgi:hypothetical protein
MFFSFTDIGQQVAFPALGRICSIGIPIVTGADPY